MRYCGGTRWVRPLVLVMGPGGDSVCGEESGGVEGPGGDDGVWPVR